MEEMKSKVYILFDEENRITRCEGGYGMPNIQNIDEWTFIDEGVGDRYNHCQGGYFEKGLMTQDGIYQYKYVNGEVLERTEEEISAERELISTALSKETEINECKKHLADTDYVVIKIAEGVATPEEYSDVISQRREWRERINELQG